MVLCHGPLRWSDWPNCHLGCVSSLVCTSRSLSCSNLPLATSFDSILYLVLPSPSFTRYIFAVRTATLVNYVSLPMVWSTFHVSLYISVLLHTPFQFYSTLHFSFTPHLNAIFMVVMVQVTFWWVAETINYFAPRRAVLMRVN